MVATALRMTMMKNEDTIRFVREHASDDVRALALMGDRQGTVDMPWALNQIRGRQTAMKKLPTLAMTEGIVYPPHLSMEQCSSEQTATWKAAVCATGAHESMADLTGGFGIDFMAISKGYTHATYVEANSELCDTVRHNLGVLHRSANVVCADATHYLHTMGHVSLIYIDPARRSQSGARTYAIADCSPDVTALCDELLAKADRVLVKLSPMLDWHEAVRQLRGVREVHIVSVDNECKELLLLLSGQSSAEAEAQPMPPGQAAPLVRCVDFTTRSAEPLVETFSAAEATESPAILTGAVAPGAYLYEPSASVMKGGCFGPLCRRYGLRMVAPNSHLFVGDAPGDFRSGRCFRVVAVSTLNRKQQRRALGGIERANVSVRNFPLSADQLRRRLGLRDGGPVYIFGTTLSDGGHVVLICEKIR